MDLYTKLVSGFLFPLHEKLKKHHTVQVRRNMEQSQWLSPDELKALQLKNLKVFLYSPHMKIEQTIMHR